jgi:hypothetical protein
MPVEVPVLVPLHARRRRADGGWEVDDDALAMPAPAACVSAIGVGVQLGVAGVAAVANLSDLSEISDLSNLSNLSNLSHLPLPLSNPSNISISTISHIPSFEVPSIPASFAYSQDMAEPGVEGVDYDTFLRSPSPPAPGRPMQSTTMSQVPPASQAASQVGNTTADASNASNANTTSSTSLSSAALVSPPRGVPMTQAIPPPTTAITPTPTPSQDGNEGSPIQIAFGAAASQRGRKVSMSGFAWGLGSR